MIRGLLCLFLLTSFTSGADVPQLVRQAEQERIKTIEEIAPAVVAIFAAGGQGGGSGVLVSADGWAVTNFHVVQGQGGFMQCGLNDGKVYWAVLAGIDPTGDLAMIKLQGRDDFPHAKIGDSDTVRMGDMTFALGNPFLLATDLQPTVTYGMVSGTHRYQYPAGTFLEYTDCIQVDTSINPGNSGGPLFNAAGELIGINGRISVEKRGRVNVGAGYAISINQVMNFLDHLKSGRIVDHATLGATVASLSDGTVVVRNILERSPAFRRGLRSNDELISFAGRPIRSVNQFKNILGIYPKGWTLPLSYQRDGERFDINVRLMALHRRAELGGGAPAQPEPDQPPEEREGDDEDAPPPLTPPHAMMEKPTLDIPEEYKEMFVEKNGFANYYFNNQAQERLLKAFADWGEFQQAWALTGKAVDELPVQFRIQPDAVAAKIGDAVSLQPLDEDFVDEPEGTGGLLAALYQFQQFLIDPHDYFTEFHYLGSEPLAATGERVDVLYSTRGLVQCRWYFTKDAEPRFLGFDCFLEEDLDPCEVRVDQVESMGDVRFPRQMTVSHQDKSMQFVFDSLSFYTPKEKP